MLAHKKLIGHIIKVIKKMRRRPKIKKKKKVKLGGKNCFEIGGPTDQGFIIFKIE